MSAYTHPQPRVDLVVERHRDGRRFWRAELYLDGRLIDCTDLADHPADATRDGQHLALQWSRSRRWTPEAVTSWS